MEVEQQRSLLSVSRARHGRRGPPLFISWVNYTRRSESVAQGIGARDVYIEYGKAAPSVFLPWRYLVQAWRTWRALSDARPCAVGVMNPPIVLPLTAWLWCAVHRVPLAIDSHTGAFLGKWGRFLPCHRWVSRRARCTIVTNSDLARTVTSWGARAFVLPIEIPDFEPRPAGPVPERPRLTVVQSFSADEPLEEVLTAARELNDCVFFVTGRIPEGRRAWVEREAPENVTFTDYLSDKDYRRRLRDSDVVLVLVRFGDTLLQGGAETVAVEVPLITSDWPVLRAFFSRGTVYVDNRPESIVEAVRGVLSRHESLCRDMRSLKATLRDEWSDQVRALRELVEGRAT